MALTTETTSPNGKSAVASSVRRRPPGQAPLQKRRRQVPWILAGVLLIVGSALAFGVAWVRLSHGEEVLAVSQPVAVSSREPRLFSKSAPPMLPPSNPQRPSTS